MSNTSKNLIGEIADILAAGLMRVAARKSREFPANSADKAVDFERVRSGAVAERVAENAL